MQKRRAAADVFMEQNVMPEPAKPAYVQEEAEEPAP